MLVTLSEILNKAERGKYAVIAPDFTTMASIRYHLEAAEEFKAPLILSSTLFSAMQYFPLVLFASLNSSYFPRAV